MERGGQLELPLPPESTLTRAWGAGLYTESYRADQFSLVASTTAGGAGAYLFRVYHRRTSRYYTEVNGNRSATVTALTADRVEVSARSYSAYTVRARASTDPAIAKTRVAFYRVSNGHKSVLARVTTAADGFAIRTVKVHRGEDAQDRGHRCRQ